MAYYKYGSSTPKYRSRMKLRENNIQIEENDSDGIRFLLTIRNGERRGGVFRWNYDQYDENDFATMKLDVVNFGSLMCYNTSKKYIRFHRVTLWARVAEDELHFIAWNNIWKDGSVKIDKGGTFIPLVANDGSFTEGISTYVNDDVKQDLTLPYAGNVTFVVECKYQKKGGSIQTAYFKCDHQPLLDDTADEPLVFNYPITVYAPVLVKDLKITNFQTDFYHNERFYLGVGAVVTAVYKYVCAGITKNVPVISNYSITPAIGSYLKINGTNKVRVSYKTAFAEYNIKVHGIDAETTFANLPELPKYIKLGSFGKSVQNTEITYDDGQTSSEGTTYSSTVYDGYVGGFDVSYYAISTLTKEYVRWGTAEETRIEDAIIS